MIQAKDFISAILPRGYNFFTGVPCSLLKTFINYVIEHPDLDYITAASEGEAVGIAAGAYLGGKKAVVMSQNSGLGNMLNPLTSLNFPFKIPALIILTLRGEPGLKDEPQHELMGQITCDLLNASRIPWSFFPKNLEAIETAMDKAENIMLETKLPYVFIMKKGDAAKTSEEIKLIGGKEKSVPVKKGNIKGTFKRAFQDRISRRQAIKSIRKLIPDKYAVIASTGKIGRELYDYADKDNHLYVVGSMGCAPAIGLGIQRARPQQGVVVLDGDGAILMKMGILATIGHYQPSKLIHIILDNESYESTGGQSTVSSSADFCEIASACGYNRCYRADSLEELKNVFMTAEELNGQALVHVKIAPGSESKVGRPDLAPSQVKERFMNFLNTRKNER